MLSGRPSLLLLGFWYLGDPLPTPSLVWLTGQDLPESTWERKPRPPQRKRCLGCREHGAKSQPGRQAVAAVPGGRWLLGRDVQRNLPSCPASGSDVPFSGRGEVQVRTMWGKLDKSDSSQLLAEFLKNHHALEESLVVQLLPRDLTHQLLAHQEQFARELGYPLNSLHQVPDHPDEHREQTPAARGQVDVGIQEVLVDKGVGEKGKPGQD